MLIQLCIIPQAYYHERDKTCVFLFKPILCLHQANLTAEL